MTEHQRRTTIAGSARPRAREATKVRTIDPEQVVEVLLLLRRRAGGELPHLADWGAHPLRARRHLTRAEFAARHGADTGDAARVRDFAARHGLNVAAVNIARRSVVLQGRAADVGAAFGVRLLRYERPDGIYLGHEGELSLPADSAAIIAGVFGLDTRPIARPYFRRARLTPADAVSSASSFENTGYLTPPQVAQFYGFPTGATGAGQCIAIIELGGGYEESDLQDYFAWLGLPAPTVTAVSVAGGQNLPVGSANSADSEVLLDIEVAGAVAPGARLAVYFAPNSERGFIEAVSVAVHDDDNRPTALAISWGEDESYWSAQSKASFDQILQEAAALGVTVCAAAGDYGSSDGIYDGAAHVSFPAASPYALACGGTSLMQAEDGQTEVVWNELAYGGGATGGGVSATFALPDYQQAAGVPVVADKPGRGVPDVAGLADSQTAYMVRVDGFTSVIGGTSAVAPLWAGLVALLNESLGAEVGFLNPLLYGPLAAAQVTRNITSGDNGAYQAGPGWDACTGLGSPNGGKLLAALKSINQ